MTAVRPLPAAMALVALAAAWSPLPEAVLPPFADGMARHMALVAVVAPLAVLALPDLVRRLELPVLLGAVLEFVVVWAWHAPALYARADASVLWLVAEQGSFLFAGLLVWAGAFGARSGLAGAGALLLTSMHMTLLGALFTLARSDFCGAGLAAQQLGGLIMLGVGTPIYLAGGLWLTGRALRGAEA